MGRHQGRPAGTARERAGNVRSIGEGRPGAGEEGGQVVAQGTPADIITAELVQED